MLRVIELLYSDKDINSKNCKLKLAGITQNGQKCPIFTGVPQLKYAGRLGFVKK